MWNDKERMTQLMIDLESAKTNLSGLTKDMFATLSEIQKFELALEQAEVAFELSHNALWNNAELKNDPARKLAKERAIADIGNGEPYLLAERKQDLAEAQVSRAQLDYQLTEQRLLLEAHSTQVRLLEIKIVYSPTEDE